MSEYNIMTSDCLIQIMNYEDLLTQDNLYHLTSSNIYVFIDAIAEIADSKCFVRDSQQYLISSYPHVEEALKKIITTSFSTVLNSSTIEQKKLEQFLTSLNKIVAKRRSIPLLKTLPIQINSLIKIYTQAKSVDLFISACRLCHYYQIIIKNSKNYLQEYIDILKLGKNITSTNKKEGVSINIPETCPQCFKNQTNQQNIKINAFCSLELNKLKVAQNNISSFDFDRYIAHLTNKNSYWMLELLSETQNQICSDVFVSIIQSNVDFEKMKYVGAQQYLAPEILNEDSMVLAAKSVIEQSYCKNYVKKVFLQHNDITILKYPPGVYQKLVFHTSKVQAWITEDISAFTENLIEFMKTYFTHIFQGTILTKVGHDSFQKLSQTQEIQLSIYCLQMLKNMTNHQHFFTYFNQIYKNQIIPLSVCALKLFLNRKTDKTTKLCWHLFGMIAQILGIHVSEGPNISQIMSGSLLSDLSNILLNHQYPLQPHFPKKLNKLFSNGYQLLLSKSKPNNKSIHQQLTKKIIKYFFKFPFVKCGHKTSSRRLGRVPEKPLYLSQLLEKLVKEVNKNIIKKQFEYVYQQILQLKVQHYLMNRACFQRIIRIVRIMNEIISIVKYLQINSIEDILSRILVKFPLILSVDNFKFKGRDMLLKQIEFFEHNWFISNQKQNTCFQNITIYLKQNNFQLKPQSLMSALATNEQVLALISNVNNIIISIKIPNTLLCTPYQGKSNASDIEEAFKEIIRDSNNLFKLLNMLLSFHINNAVSLYNYVLYQDTNQLKKYMEIYQQGHLDSQSAINSSIDGIIILLHSFLNSTYNNIKLSIFEKNNVIVELYEEFSNGISLLFEILEEQNVHPMSIIIVSETIYSILLKIEHNHPVNFLKMIHTRLGLRITKFLHKIEQSIPKTNQSSKTISSYGSLQKILQSFQSKGFALNYNPIKEIYQNHIHFLMDSFYGINITICNWIVNVETYETRNREMAKDLILKQFQAIISLVNASTVQFYKNVLFSYINKEQLFIEPSRRHNNSSRSNDILRANRRREGFWTSPNEFRYMMGYNGRINDLQTQLNSILGGGARNLFSGWQNLRSRVQQNKEPSLSNNDSSFQKGMRDLRLSLISKLQPLLYMEKYCALELIQSCISNLSKEYTLQMLIQKIIGRLHDRLQINNGQFIQSSSSDSILTPEQNEVFSIIYALQQIMKTKRKKQDSKTIFNKIYDTTIIKDVVTILLTLKHQKYDNLIIKSLSLLKTILPNVQIFDASLIPSFFQVAEAAYQASQRVKNFKAIKHVMMEIASKTMTHVLNCKQLSYFSDIYAGLINLEKMNQNTEESFSQIVMSMNSYLTQISMEAQIKSFLLAKDAASSDLKFVTVYYSEFVNYFSKYHKLPSFENICKRILVKQSNENKKNIKIVYYKTKNSFSQSKIMGKPFSEYPISYGEKQVLKVIQKSIIRNVILSKQMAKNLTYFIYKIGILNPHLLLDKVQQTGQVFLDVLIQKVYGSPETQDLIFMLCLDKTMVLSMNGKQIQYSSYIRWKIICKLYNDFEGQKIQFKRPILLLLLYLLQFKEMHVFVNLKYSSEKPSLRELIQEKIDPSDPIICEVLNIIYRNGNMQALSGLYSDTKSNKSLTSEARFQNQLVPLPFIYNQNQQSGRERQQILQNDYIVPFRTLSEFQERAYGGQFLPIQKKNKPMEEEENIQKQIKFLDNYYNTIQFSKRELQQQIPFNSNDELQKFKFIQCKHKPFVNLNLTFVNGKNQQFYKRFKELSKITYKEQFQSANKEIESSIEEPNDGNTHPYGLLRISDLNQSSDNDQYIDFSIRPEPINRINQINASNFSFFRERRERIREEGSERIQHPTLLLQLRELQDVEAQFQLEQQRIRQQQQRYASRQAQNVSRMEQQLISINPNNISELQISNFGEFQQVVDNGVQSIIQQNSQNQISEPIAVQNQPPIPQRMIPIDPPQIIRPVLEMMGLPQNYLRQNGIDQILFDDLPQEMQVDVIIGIQPSSDRIQQQQQIPQTTQNITLEFLQNIPQQLRGEVMAMQGINLQNIAPNPQEEQNQLIAAILSMEDQTIRQEMLLQIAPQRLLNFPNQLQIQAERARRNASRRPHLDMFAALNEQSILNPFLQRVRRERKPAILDYPVVGKQLFRSISERAASALLRTIWCSSSCLKTDVIETLLQNKMIQQPVINSLIKILRNPLEAFSLEINTRKHEGKTDESDRRLEHTVNVESIKLQILNIIFKCKKKMIYRDFNFLKEKYSYKMLNGLNLSSRKQLFCEKLVTQQFHYPYVELLLQSLKVNSPLSVYLLKGVNSQNMPIIILESIINIIQRQDLPENFITNLKGFSKSSRMKKLFNQKFPFPNRLKLRLYGKLLQNQFAQTSYIKQLHLQALSKYKLQYSNFINQAYKFYSIEQLKEMKQLQQFKHIHHKVIKHLLKEKVNIVEQPISKILELPLIVSFTTKKDVFYDAMNRINADNRVGRLSLRVKRNDQFQSSYKQIMSRTKQQMRGELRVTFEGEKGSDMSGLTKEWFIQISKQMFDPNYGLFQAASSGNTSHPSSNSSINPDHLNYFKYIGRTVGKALSQQYLMDIHFTHSFFKMVLGKQMQFKDMEDFDLKYYQNMEFYKNNPVEDLTFSYMVDKFGEVKVKELIPGGQNISVTEENKLDYINRMCIVKMKTQIEQQTKAFAEGLFEVVPSQHLRYFTPQEFQLLITGVPTIDVNDFKYNTEYERYESTSQVIKWFWQVIFEFNQQELAKLLQFITGSNRVPAQGFRGFRGAHGRQKISIHRESNTNHLPSAHTCFNQLDLPDYKSKQDLQKKLRTAITFGCLGFEEV